MQLALRVERQRSNPLANDKLMSKGASGVFTRFDIGL